MYKGAQVTRKGVRRSRAFTVTVLSQYREVSAIRSGKSLGKSGLFEARNRNRTWEEVLPGAATIVGTAAVRGYATPTGVKTGCTCTYTVETPAQGGIQIFGSTGKIKKRENFRDYFKPKSKLPCCVVAANQGRKRNRTALVRITLDTIPLYGFHTVMRLNVSRKQVEGRAAIFCIKCWRELPRALE